MSSISPPSFGTVSVRGIRGSQKGYQHDRVLTHVSDKGSVYVVFDGHGALQYGHKVAEMCQKQFIPLLQTSSAWNAAPMIREERDEELVKDLAGIVEQLEKEADPGSAEEVSYPGSTLCAILIKDGWLYTVNVGDSRAVLGEAVLQDGRSHSLLTRPVQLTRDHVCNDPREHERIKEAGGIVLNGRLNGELDMSRTIGDHEFKTYRNHPRFNKRGVTYKNPLVIATPEITARFISEKDIFVALGTDGLWSDSIRNDMVILHAEGGLLLNMDPRRIAESLVELAIEHGSKDNISVVFIPLNKLPEREKRLPWKTRIKTSLMETEHDHDSKRANSDLSGASASRQRSKRWWRDRRHNREPEGAEDLTAKTPKQLGKRTLISHRPQRLFRRREGADPKQAL